jgi:hypothetical protein
MIPRFYPSISKLQQVNTYETCQKTNKENNIKHALFNINLTSSTTINKAIENRMQIKFNAKGRKPKPKPKVVINKETLHGPITVFMLSIVMFFWSQIYSEIWKLVVENIFKKGELLGSSQGFILSGFIYLMLTRNQNVGYFLNLISEPKIKAM